MAPRNPTILSKEVPPVSKPRRQPSFSKKLYATTNASRSIDVSIPKDLLIKAQSCWVVRLDQQQIPGWPAGTMAIVRDADRLHHKDRMYLVHNGDLSKGAIATADGDGNAIDVSRRIPIDECAWALAFRVIGLVHRQENADGTVDTRSQFSEGGLFLGHDMTIIAPPIGMPEVDWQDANLDVWQACNQLGALEYDMPPRRGFALAHRTSIAPALVKNLDGAAQLDGCEFFITSSDPFCSRVLAVRPVPVEEMIDGRVYIGATQESADVIIGVAQGGMIWDTCEGWTGLHPFDASKVHATDEQSGYVYLHPQWTKCAMVGQVVGLIGREGLTYSEHGFLPTGTRELAPAPAQEVAA